MNAEAGDARRKTGDPREDPRFTELFQRYVEELQDKGFVDPDAIVESHPDIGLELVEDLETYIQLRPPGETTPEAPLGTLGDYTLRRQIGRGGMGVVYEAWQGSVDRTVALKVLPPALAADDRAYGRFMQEARAAGKLSHPNVVAVYASGQDESTPYYAMEYVDGETLAQVLGRIRDVVEAGETEFGKRGELAFYSNLASAFADVADGLQHAHSKGVTHRDIKPSNLILDRDGRLRILDFGLARLEGQESLTLSGDFVGTPLYMSPEQARRKKIPVDHRTDVYSLGATMYEAICGRPPFRGKDHADTLSQIIQRDPADPRKVNPRVPKDLETVVLKCLRKDSGDRYGTAEALGQDLRRFVRGDAIEARAQSEWERLARRMWLQRYRLSVGVSVLFLVLAASFLAVRQYRIELAENQRERESEYERRVLSDLVKLQLAKVSLRERENLERIFETKYSAYFTLDRVSLETARALIEAAVEDLEGVAELLPERSEARDYRAAGLWLLEKTEDAPSGGILPLRLASVPTRSLSAPSLAGDAEAGSLAGSETAPPGERDDISEWQAAYEEARAWRWGRAAEAYEGIYERVLEQGERHLGLALDALVEAGYARLENNEPDRALENFLRAERFAGSGNPELALLVGRCWHLLGREARAEALFDALYERSSSPREIALLVAISYMVLNDVQEVLRWAERVSPADLERRLKATALLKLGRFDDALAEAQSACEVAPQDFRNFLALTGAREYLGRRDAAFEAFEKARELHPTGRWIRLLRALKLGRSTSTREEAWQILKDLEKEYPRWAYLHWALASFANDRNVTFSHLQKALELNPKLVIVRALVAFVLAKRGRFQDAHEELDRALELDPGCVDLLATRELVYRLQGEPEKALEAMHLCLEEAQGRPMELQRYWVFLHTRLAILLLLDGQAEEAKAAFEEALTRPDIHNYPGWAHSQFGFVGHYAVGNHAEAARLLDRALELGAGSADTRNYLFAARARERLGDLRDAVVRTTEAIAADPPCGRYREYSGDLAPTILLRILRRDTSLLDDAPTLERVAGAVRLLEEARPADPEVLGLRVLLHHHSGEIAEAVRALERLLELPNVKRDTEGELERLRTVLGLDLPSYASIDAALDKAALEDLVARGAQWQLLRGTAEPSDGQAWTQPEFDGSWEAAPVPIGYGKRGLKTRLEDMRTSYTSVYLRHEFEVVDRDRCSRLLLSVRADDGFVAYLNGREVKRVNVESGDGPVSHDAVAVSKSLEPLAPVDVWLPPDLLRSGRNVLAIHGLNESTQSGDFLLDPVLRCEIEPSAGEYRELLEAFRKVATGENLPARLAYFEGRVFELTGDHAEAVRKFTEVVAEDRERTRPWLRLAESLRAAGKPGEAEERLRGVLRRERAARERRIWDAWLEMCFGELRMSAADVASVLPRAERADGSSDARADGDPAEDPAGYARSLVWLLDRLRRGEPVRINCGGGDYTSSDGASWGRDRFSVEGRVGGSGAGREIRGTEDDPLYRTARYFPVNERLPGTYRLPLPAGEYRLTLHFAECYLEKQGFRRFDVVVEDDAVLEAFEPLRHGFATAHSESCSAQVLDGLLDIQLVPGNQNPEISAIEIEVSE